MYSNVGVNIRGYIPLGDVFTLRLQLSPMQANYTGYANDFTSILYGLLIRMRYIWGPI